MTKMRKIKEPVMLQVSIGLKDKYLNWKAEKGIEPATAMFDDFYISSQVILLGMRAILS